MPPQLGVYYSLNGVFTPLTLHDTLPRNTVKSPSPSTLLLLLLLYSQHTDNLH